ncbi:MAG: DNA methyltransferase [Candidatus Limnocylindrales bacterium]
MRTPAEFAAKWQGSTQSERAASQEHFIDLCRMLGQPTPNDADPTGDWYAFEKGAGKAEGGEGFADVWMRDHFAWEYKGKRKDLAAAYSQLNGYREALGNPPLLVVCDLARFEIHTNFTNTVPRVYRFTLDDLAADPGEPLRILRSVFTDPESLRPTRLREELTERAAQDFAALATALRSRGHHPHAVAHFLDRLLFAMFAEDAGILPKNLIDRLSSATKGDASAFSAALHDLFGKMAKGGGLFGVERIEWFNGGLFDDAEVIALAPAEMETIGRVSKLDWSQIEPAIFGTLFERGLDPDQRTQLGAHYTDRASILRLVEPVLMAPLRRDWAETQAKITPLVLAGRKVTARTPADQNPERIFRGFLERLRVIRVLDPACGSGNFLYISLQLLKDLEYEAIQWGSLVLRIPQEFPQVGPQNLLGIEINPFAAELARVTIWIGQIQWMLAHGLGHPRDPVLQPLNNIRERDALLDISDPSHPREAEWPQADVVVGNPPFLGGKLLRTNLGDRYVEAMFEVYDGRVPAEADLCAYWHEKARAQIESDRLKRAGLLATQGIRGGANRHVLERIKRTGDVFFAYADEPWVLAGANVHISFVGQDDGSQAERTLDGAPVAHINADLTSGLDLTQARHLPENLGLSFMGDTKGGPFDIDADTARRLLASPNPDGRGNADVVRPWANGLDITRRPRDMWIVDFGIDLAETEAALYEAPFEYVREHVRPERIGNKRAAYAERWWLHVEARSGMRKALAGLPRYLATPNLTKHRLFAWLDAKVLPDHQIIVVARDDDYTFGVLHSRVHEAWTRATGTQLREVESGFRYTPTSCFETFPFPRPTDAQREAIAEAARDLDRLRTGWLNPTGLSLADLAKRTLTNLYNARPTWLSQAHEGLDAAVLAAYGWSHDLAGDALLGRLLELNLARSGENADLAGASSEVVAQ